MSARRLSMGRRFLLLVAAAWMLAMGVVAPRSTRAAEPPLVVVVGADSPLRDISRNTLRRLFLAEVTEQQGVRLVPLNQPPGTSARAGFDRKVLGLEPEAMARFWIDQRIRGHGSAPRSVPTVSLLLRVLAKLPGGISYARSTDVPPGAPGVRILTIDGKTPGQPGYLLE